MFILRFLWQWADKTSGGLSVIILILSKIPGMNHIFDFSTTAFCALGVCAVIQGIKLWKLEHPPKPFSLDIIKEQTADICKFDRNDGICVFYLKISNSASSPTQNVKVYIEFINATDRVPSNYELADDRGKYGCEINSKGFALYPLFCAHKDQESYYQAWLAPFKVAPDNEYIEDHSEYFIQKSVAIKVSINSRNGIGEFNIKLNVPPDDGRLADITLSSFK
jgi:hypothetical protein